MSANDLNLVLSPLADPVVSAMYPNVEKAGLAMGSLINSTLKEDNQQLDGEIESVTPQSSYTDVENRGCRVDIETRTNVNSRVITQIQINPDPRIMIRNIFEASHIFVGTSTKGDDHAALVANMPRIIFINILTYNLRKSNKDLVQPYKVLYTKEPTEVAIPHFSGYNIQLHRIPDMTPDFTNDLFCWGYTLYTAHKKEMTIKEVLAMTPQLQEYAERDLGYQQFCDRYDFASADAKTRREYMLWAKNRMREEGERDWIKKEAMEEVALAMLKLKRPINEIALVTGLSVEEVEALKNSLTLILPV